MTDLTIEQVRGAGRFAWHAHGFVFAYGRVIFMWAKKNHVNNVPRFKAAEGAENQDSGLFTKGWHHEDGCDCPYCREA
jgi:hypothetical protein